MCFNIFKTLKLLHKQTGFFFTTFINYYNITLIGSKTKTPKTVPKTKDISQSFVLSEPNSNEYKNVKNPPVATQIPIKMYAINTLHQGSSFLFFFVSSVDPFSIFFPFLCIGLSLLFLKMATMTMDGIKVMREDMNPTKSCL